MALLFTADTHFGDNRANNIHRRPFASVPEMDAALITGWISLIGADDGV